MISLACAGFIPSKVLESEPSYKVCVYNLNVVLCSPHIRFLCNDLNVSLPFHLREVNADFTQTRALRLKPAAGLSVWNVIWGNP